MKPFRILVAVVPVAAVSLIHAQTPARSAAERAPAAATANAPFWTGISDAASFDRAMTDRIARARATLDRMLAVKGARTLENTLQPYDDVLLEIDAVGSQAGLIQVVHPDAKMRATAEAISQKISAFGTELALNRGVCPSTWDVSAISKKTTMSRTGFIRTSFAEFYNAPRYTDAQPA